jgi:phosphoserine phosphatase
MITSTAWRADLPSAPSEQSTTLIKKLSHEAKIDTALLPADLQLHDFKLLVMDMDSTLITIECIDEIADMQGLKSEVAAITEAAMRGELDFAESLQRRVALLKGLDESALARVFEQRLELTLGAHSMLHAMKQAGLRTVLVSGGFTYFTERLEHELELDVSHANRLEVIDGKLTGRVLGNIVDAQAKKSTVIEQSAELGVPTSAAIVIGDGANDLAMMSVAGLSIAFRAKPVVQAKAHVALNYSGLDGVISLFL